MPKPIPRKQGNIQPLPTLQDQGQIRQTSTPVSKASIGGVKPGGASMAQLGGSGKSNFVSILEGISAGIGDGEKLKKLRTQNADKFLKSELTAVDAELDKEGFQPHDGITRQQERYNRFIANTPNFIKANRKSEDIVTLYNSFTTSLNSDARSSRGKDLGSKLSRLNSFPASVALQKISELEEAYPDHSQDIKDARDFQQQRQEMSTYSKIVDTAYSSAIDDMQREINDLDITARKSGVPTSPQEIDALNDRLHEILNESIPTELMDDNGSFVVPYLDDVYHDSYYAPAIKFIRKEISGLRKSAESNQFAAQRSDNTVLSKRFIESDPKDPSRYYNMSFLDTISSLVGQVNAYEDALVKRSQFLSNTSLDAMVTFRDSVAKRPLENRQIDTLHVEDYDVALKEFEAADKRALARIDAEIAKKARGYIDKREGIASLTDEEFDLALKNSNYADRPKLIGTAISIRHIEDQVTKAFQIPFLLQTDEERKGHVTDYFNLINHDLTLAGIPEGSEDRQKAQLTIITPYAAELHARAVKGGSTQIIDDVLSYVSKVQTPGTPEANDPAQNINGLILFQKARLDLNTLVVDAETTIKDALVSSVSSVEQEAALTTALSKIRIPSNDKTNKAIQEVESVLNRQRKALYPTSDTSADFKTTELTKTLVDFEQSGFHNMMNSEDPEDIRANPDLFRVNGEYRTNYVETVKDKITALALEQLVQDTIVVGDGNIDDAMVQQALSDANVEQIEEAFTAIRGMLFEGKELDPSKLSFISVTPDGRQKSVLNNARIGLLISTLQGINQNPNAGKADLDKLADLLTSSTVGGRTTFSHAMISTALSLSRFNHDSVDNQHLTAATTYVNELIKSNAATSTKVKAFTSIGSMFARANLSANKVRALLGSMPESAKLPLLAATVFQRSAGKPSNQTDGAALKQTLSFLVTSGAVLGTDEDSERFTKQQLVDKVFTDEALDQFAEFIIIDKGLGPGDDPRQLLTQAADGIFSSIDRADLKNIPLLLLQKGSANTKAKVGIWLRAAAEGHINLTDPSTARLWWSGFLSIASTDRYPTGLVQQDGETHSTFFITPGSTAPGFHDLRTRVMSTNSDERTHSDPSAVMGATALMAHAAGDFQYRWFVDRNFPVVKNLPPAIRDVIYTLPFSQSSNTAPSYLQMLLYIDQVVLPDLAGLRTGSQELQKRLGFPLPAASLNFQYLPRFGTAGTINPNTGHYVAPPAHTVGDVSGFTNLFQGASLGNFEHLKSLSTRRDTGEQYGLSFVFNNQAISIPPSRFPDLRGLKDTDGRWLSMPPTRSTLNGQKPYVKKSWEQSYIMPKQGDEKVDTIISFHYSEDGDKVLISGASRLGGIYKDIYNGLPTLTPRQNKILRDNKELVEREATVYQQGIIDVKSVTAWYEVEQNAGTDPVLKEFPGSSNVIGHPAARVGYTADTMANYWKSFLKGASK